MSNFQRKNAVSNTQVGIDFEDIALSHFSKEIPDLHKEFRIAIGFKEKKSHKFDLGSSLQNVIIECKSHTWTTSGNMPSAKLTTWDQAMFYFFLAPDKYRKIMFVKKDLKPKSGESLCNYYMRTHANVIPDGIEFWEADEGAEIIRRVDNPS
ncbi:MAG: hypothetical protein IH859_04855 [Chloroflexi bacterium]|nr:hypothetical protein [Chloroflexota bacterium]